MHLTRAVSRSESYASLSKVRIHGVPRAPPLAAKHHKQRRSLPPYNMQLCRRPGLCIPGTCSPHWTVPAPRVLNPTEMGLPHLQALGRESAAPDLDAAERGDSDSDAGMPAGSVVKAWHGRCGYHELDST